MQQKNKTIKRLISFSLLLLLIISGFAREFLFKKINSHIEAGFIPEHSAQIIKAQDIIGRMSQSRLYATKWILTGFFISFFFVVSSFLTWHLFKSKKFLMYLGLFYGGIIVIAVVCIFTGIASGHYMESYSIVRPLMGILQSPIPVVVIVPAIWFFEKHIS